MNSPIFLTGYGQTKFGEWWDKGLRDLAEEAMTAAITNANIPSTAVDMIIVGNMIGELGSDQAHLGSLVSSLLPHHPPALRVEAACASGSVALHTACALLESNRAKTVLVLGAEKMTDASTEAIAAALMGAADSEKDRPSGLTFPGIFGLIAARYMHEYGLTREDLSLVSAVHHRQAVENPFAQFRSEISPEHISCSSPISDPLRLLDCSPITDGAAACILSTTCQSSIRIAASQLATDTLSISDRPSITSFTATQKAFQEALQEAGITRDDIACLETHDCFSIAAVINMEDLGFAECGEGIEIYRKIFENPEASPFAVNRSGGLKACGHPVGATGIKQVIDTAKYLKTTNTRFGAAHNFGGAGATCCLHILEHTAL